MKSSVSILSNSIEYKSLPNVPIEEPKENASPLQSPLQANKVSSYYKIPSDTIKATARLSKRSSFTNIYAQKQYKTSDLNKINEYAVLKVYEHKNYPKTSSAHSRMSDTSLPNLPDGGSYFNKLMSRMPAINIEYCKTNSCIEERGNRGHQGCIYLPKLQPSQVEFLRLVTENNVENVERYLDLHPALNINCVNFQGISALHIAIRNRSEEMVEFLLKYPQTELGDTVLHAIRHNCIIILVMLLDAQKTISPGLEFAGATHSTIFPAHITPLILAAQLNNYEIVNLLMSRGHTIIRPHSPNCDCINCKKCVVNEDGLHASSARLSVYRAISSAAYLVHFTSDPILEAFLLTEELSANAAYYRHFSAKYFQLKDQVGAFAVGLIANCRTSNEIEVILKQKAGCEGRRHFVLPRLLMAVTYKQLEFVAHPNTQQVLESYWLGDWYSWRRKSFLAKAMTVFCRIFMLPIILLFCMIIPWHSLVKHYQIPLNKLITHVASYFVFLCLVFYISNQDKTTLQRGPPNTGMVTSEFWHPLTDLDEFIKELQIVSIKCLSRSECYLQSAEGPLVLYVCGYTWSAIRMCVMQGPRRFFTAMWNWAEIIMLTLFWLTMLFWVAAAVDSEEEFKIERKYWNQYDPTLLAEGTFCLATIFAFFRLMFLCQLSYHLGPLQVSLGKMTYDIYKYVIVFAIIISAFAAGLSRFYQYYDGMVYEDRFGMKTVQVSSFTSLTDTLNTLFWALFCMAPMESADIVLENTRGPKERHTIDGNRHGYTERIGYFCFGCFEVISVIVVLNMLIATMSNTFQSVTDNVAIEWTFGKTEVYIDYMSQTTLPSPFNLIPTTSGLASVYEWFRTGICKINDSQARWSLSYCCFIEREIEANVQKEFPSLMSVLVQRYFSNNSENTPYCDLETIRHDTNSIKNVVMKKPEPNVHEESDYIP